MTRTAARRAAALAALLAGAPACAASPDALGRSPNGRTYDVLDASGAAGVVAMAGLVTVARDPSRIGHRP